MGLVDWLREQVAEDERVALAASPPPWTDGGYGEFGWVVHSEPYTEDTLSVELSDSDQGLADVAYLTRFDPARVLAEVTAKRDVLRHHAPGGAASRFRLRVVRDELPMLRCAGSRPAVRLEARFPPGVDCRTSRVAFPCSARHQRPWVARTR
jgi:hypothetical protein